MKTSPHTFLIVFLLICSGVVVYAAKKINLPIYSKGKILGIPSFIFTACFLLIMGVGYGIRQYHEKKELQK